MATIRKRGSKWQCIVRRDGRTASKSFAKRVDAVKWGAATEAQADAVGGSLPTRAQTEADTVQAVTVADALAVFRDDVTPTHRSGDREARCIDALLKHHKSFTRLRLDALTSADVSNWRDRRLKQVSPSTVRREMTLLRSAVGHAIGAAAVNVVAQVKRPKADDQRERRLQHGEWQALLDACDAGRNTLIRPLIVLVVETGMRRGELLSMQWRHIDLQRCTVFLPKTKNGHARTVPLSPSAVDVLSSLPRTDDRCIPLSGDCVRQGFERVRRRAGSDDLRFHDLRHECISRLVERGLTLFEVQQVSGHRTLQMLQRYVHLQVSGVVAKLHAAE